MLGDLLGKGKQPARRAPESDARPFDGTVGGVGGGPHVLYLANDPQEVRYISSTMGRTGGLEFEFADSFEAARVRVRYASKFDAVLIGWSMPDALALTLLHKAHLEDQLIPVIVAGERSTLQFREAGAFECLRGGDDFMKELPRVMQAALRVRRGPALDAPGTAHGVPESPARIALSKTDPSPVELGAATPAESAPKRIALFGNAANLLSAGLGTVEGPELHFVPVKELEPAATCDVVLLDHGDHRLDLAGLATTLRARTPRPLVVVLASPNEPVTPDLLDLIDDFHAKAPGWIVQLPPRLQLVLRRASRTEASASAPDSDGQLAELLDALPTAVIRLDRTGEMQAVNPAAVTLLGASEPSQLRRQPFHPLLTPESRNAWASALQDATAGQTQSLELALVNLTGVQQDVTCFLTALPSAPGDSPLMMVLQGVVRDRRSIDVPVPSPDVPTNVETHAAATSHTETLLAFEREMQALTSRARDTFAALEADLQRASDEREAASTARRERLQVAAAERWQSVETFVREAASGMCQLDADDQLTDGNESLAGMLGYPSAAELASRVRTLVDLSDAEALALAVVQWREGQPNSWIDVPCRRADRSMVVLRVHGARVTDPDGRERVQLIAEDLGERPRLETRLRRAQKWEQAFKATAGLAADLRRGLTAIDTAAQQLRERDASGQHDSGQLDELCHATAKALALGGQLLAYGGREARAVGPLDLNDAVSATQAVIRRTVDEPVELTVDPSHEACLVAADQHGLEELIVNVVHAAAAALPVGGRITLRTDRVDVPSSEQTIADQEPPVAPGLYSRLSVEASGWGLDRNALVGPPADTAIGRGLSGTLGTADRATTRLGGVLTVETQARESLTVRIYLPRA